MLAHIRGALTLLSYIIFTAIIFIVLLFVAILKLIIPIKPFRDICSRVLDSLASTGWVFCANTTHRFLTRTVFDVRGLEEVRVNSWCLLLSNHQTWVDILVLIRVFFRRVPPYKFFIKKELLWLPMMGLSFWALDFPIMKRYSKDFIEKHPHLKGQDLEATRRACEKFRTQPVTIMNFAEGTRFTHAKHKKQQSPYRHMLKPRAGGTALVLYAMGEVLEQIVDVTIVYPHGVPGLWAYFCGRTPEIIVDIRRMRVPPNLIGNYFTDPDFKDHFQQWINDVWADKDTLIDAYLAEHGPASGDSVKS
ncbi:MAG TPA: acyltransferase [Desulfosalsimonadaceae bacterium]|nr:acyltransferase [Desulfosalsimonadaceae bacterium]